MSNESFKQQHAVVWMIRFNGSICKISGTFCLPASKHRYKERLRGTHLALSLQPCPTCCISISSSLIQTVVRWSRVQATVLCKFIDHIIRHRPEIKSSQELIGCVPCQLLMQGNVAAVQVLSKLEAGVRCRLFYHSVFRLSYITHRQPWRNNLSVTLT